MVESGRCGQSRARGANLFRRGARGARPEIAIDFDLDRKLAIASRQKLFRDAVRNKLWVAAAHMPFPGLGHVRKQGDGYAWVPIEYGALPGQDSQAR